MGGVEGKKIKQERGKLLLGCFSSASEENLKPEPCFRFQLALCLIRISQRPDPTLKVAGNGAQMKAMSALSSEEETCFSDISISSHYSEK